MNKKDMQAVIDYLTDQNCDLGIKNSELHEEAEKREAKIQALESSKLRMDEVYCDLGKLKRRNTEQAKQLVEASDHRTKRLGIIQDLTLALKLAEIDVVKGHTMIGNLIMNKGKVVEHAEARL